MPPVSAPVLLGAQRPRIETCQAGDRSWGPAVCDLMGEAGWPLDEAQAHVLEVGMRTTGDRWTHRSVGYIEPRQNGKSRTMMGYLAGSVTLLDLRSVAYSTHNLGVTTIEMIDQLEDLLSSKTFGKRLKSRTRNNGRESLTMTNGAKLRFLARSRNSGRGIPLQALVMDEAFAVNEGHMSAALPTMSAQPDPQAWYVSSAPLADSLELHRLRRLGHRGTDGMAWLEWSADPDADPSLPETWAQANHTLGYRMSADHVAHEHATMSAAAFHVERLGIVNDPLTDTAIDLQVWDSMTDSTSTPGQKVTFGLDVAPGETSASIVVASRRPDGKIHVETIENHPGIAWVENRVAEVMAKRRGSILLIDASSPAAQFERMLATARSIKVQLVDRPTASRSCAAFRTAVNDGKLRHIGQSSLASGLMVARQRVSGDTWTWSRGGSNGDITMVVAASLAVGEVLAQRETRTSGPLTL